MGEIEESWRWGKTGRGGTLLCASGEKKRRELLSRTYYSVLSNVWMLHFIKSS